MIKSVHCTSSDFAIDVYYVFLNGFTCDYHIVEIVYQSCNFAYNWCILHLQFIAAVRVVELTYCILLLMLLSVIAD